jgi:hypothetical protein
MAKNMTKQEKEIYADLKNKNQSDNNYIKNWLDDIKRNGTDPELRVINPLSGKKIYTNKAGIYPIIIKWCFENLQGYDFTGIPNSKDILDNISRVASSGVASAVASNVAASGAASGITSTEDIILIVKKWKDNPTIDPYTNKNIEISIKDNSRYVTLYQHIIDKLIEKILKNKHASSNSDTLSVKDCIYIKESMPNIHAIVEIKDANNNIMNTIYYDHLFIKYFLVMTIKVNGTNFNKYKYDIKYKNEIEPYLYLIIYEAINKSFKSISTKNNYDSTEKLLLSHHLKLSEYSLSLGIFIEKLCSDIKNILYMHESKITTEKINAAIFNKEVLKYMLSIVKLSSTNTDIYNDINKHYTTLFKNKVNGRLILKNEINIINANRNHYLNNIYNIYTQIIEHIAKDSNICKTLKEVYDCILKLYADNNMKNTVYKYIKDPYNINKGVEPAIPIRERLPIDLQRYKMLSSMPNAVKNESMEKKLKEHNEKWEHQFKEYEKKKDIYDRIYEGKKSFKNNKWNGEILQISKKKHKNDDDIKIPKVLFVKYSNKLKAFTTSGNHNNSNHNVNYVNDSDPYTQENLEDLHPNKRKYVTDIVYRDKNNKEFHFWFDTVKIYNYVLKCIEECKKPMNYFINNTELTNDNLDEICNKIKHFTNKKTYNSYLEIRALLDNCKYENRLTLNYQQEFLPQRTSNPIIGYLKIYLNVDLGGILFRVINNTLPHNLSFYDNYPNQANIMNSEVLVLPLFITADWFYDIYNEATHVYPVNILFELQQILPKGDILGAKYFPYRKNNADGQQWKTIINIPKFDLDISDNAEEAFKKLKDYKEKIALL